MYPISRLTSSPSATPPIVQEMVEAMGGQGSDAYVRFRTYACEAYNILRKSADLILSLFHLMAGASIEAIRADPEKAILKLQVRRGADGGEGGRRRGGGHSMRYFMYRYPNNVQ